MDELPSLTAPEARVLGCLLEKQRTTPDVYPLTLNALVAACNQSSNRHPVVRYDDATVVTALDGLRAHGLARVVHSSSGRATKYRQVVDEALAMEPEETAILCVLLLRGPQTVGELRTRTERLHPFASLDEVDAALTRMASRWGLVRRLERMPGQKEARYVELLSADTPVVEASPATSSPPADLEERVAALEGQVAELRALLDDLTR